MANSKTGTDNNKAHGEAHGAGHDAGAHNPMDQFRVESIFDINIAGYDISFTNSAFFMVIAVACAISFMLFGTRKREMVPGRMQTVVESLYQFVIGMVRDSIGSEGSRFFPFVFTMFIFIFLCNMLGMMPYSFTVTSHIIVTFALALVAFAIITLYAIMKHGVSGFFGLFLPSGVPWWLAPMIFLIEFFSYLVRPLTLSVRLFANMVAGHVLLKVIAGFIIALGVAAGWIPLLFASMMVGFEVFVAALQAYIFAILICAYLGGVSKAH